VNLDDRVLSALADVIESRRGGDPATSYVARLLAKAPDSVLKKIGEEATETVMAAKDAGARNAEPAVRARLVAETADLWFHSLVMLAHFGLSRCSPNCSAAPAPAASKRRPRARRTSATATSRTAEFGLVSTRPQVPNHAS
jgi:phosphoribosyl-ATP pyrophosphohydrolase